MPVKDPELMAIVERLGDHYRRNIDNRFVRDALMRLMLERGDREHINVITELPEYLKLQGFDYMDLYDKIVALAKFFRQAQKEVLPSINATSSRAMSGSQEQILRSMALSNYGANLNILGDMINELYVKTVECDKRDNARDPVYAHVPELKNVGSLLVDRSS